MAVGTSSVPAVPSAVKAITPFEQLLNAAQALHPNASFHDISNAAIGEGKGASMAGLLSPVSSAAESRVTLMLAGLNDALQASGYSVSSEAVQFGLGKDESSILVMPRVVRADADGSQASRYCLPPFLEIYPSNPNFDPRTGKTSNEKLLLTRDQAIPSRVVALREPVGIILSCDPFNEIDQSRPVEFNLSETKVVWSSKAFSQAAFEISGAFDEASKPPEEGTIQSRKLSHRASRSNHLGAPERSTAMTVEDFDRLFGATDFIAGMVVDSIQREFFTDRNNIEVLVEGVRFENGALIVLARFADDLPEEIKTLRIALNKDSIAESVWI